MLRLALLFVLLIVYGSLFPFGPWRLPAEPLFAFLAGWPSELAGSDLVQNVLAYAPFGLFMALWLLQGRGRSVAIASTLMAALLLSSTMESLQQFEAVRTASLADIAMNLLGTLAGALLALALGGGPAGLAGIARLHRWRARRFRRGTLPNIGLAAVGLWALSQTCPLVPALDLLELRHKLGSLAWQWRHVHQAGPGGALVVAAQLTALGLLLRTLAPAGPQAPGRAAAADRPWMLLLAAVFAAKLLIHGRYLSIDDLLGAALALVLLQLGRRLPRRTNVLAGALVLLLGFSLGEMLEGGSALHRFNWVPLWGQMRSLAGLENILELFWPFFALAYFARCLCPPARRHQWQAVGALLVLALVFQLEWLQQQVAGRYGDITQVLLALGGWLLPWSFRSADYARPAAPPALPAPAPASIEQRA